MHIRNIAIIAHVDHGKTTLVDAMLKQSGIFRDNQKEMSQELIMDSNDLEREKGITILAKNTAIFYHDYKINIIDTPGHADFGGEVERVLNMADGAILLVDAAEGPLPQTRFVLKKALENKLKIILIINKIDKKDARPHIVRTEVESLFLELVHDEDALNFQTLYAVGRDGVAYKSLPEQYKRNSDDSLIPLFDTIVTEVREAHIRTEDPFKMVISTLDSDNYVGKLCIGRVHQGSVTKGDSVALVDMSGDKGRYTITKLYTSRGLAREEITTAIAGDIVAIAGIPQLTIGQTLTNATDLHALPTIHVDEPTIKITLGPNTSPFAGREGKYTTSRQIKERLWKEKETNLGLKIEESVDTIDFIVSGRGELHLAVLIETMRREGYELQISRPQVIHKQIDTAWCEPYEEVTVDVAPEYVGAVNEEMGKRKAVLQNMHNDINGSARLVFKISSANLLGIRNILLTKTRGTAVLSTYLLGYEPKGDKINSLRNGAIISTDTGESNTYGLLSAQERGILFIGAGVAVYEGMVVGVAARPLDVEVNVCRTKKLTNNRSAGEGVKESLTPPAPLSLEQCLDFIEEDELLEVTPVSLRVRKRFLTEAERRVYRRQKTA